MTNDLSHLTDELEEEQVTTEDALKRITRYAKAFQLRTAELKELEKLCKEKKAEVTKLGQELIPESMLEVNMTAFQLDSGEKVQFKEEISCTVKDYEILYDFLAKRGDDGLMKINLEMGKVPKEILALVIKNISETFDLLVSSKLTIHPMTLRAYIKKLCGVGGSEGEMPLAELDEEMLTTFSFYKTTVK